MRYAQKIGHCLNYCKVENTWYTFLMKEKRTLKKKKWNVFILRITELNLYEDIEIHFF